MPNVYSGILQKMRTRMSDVVEYEMPVGDELVPVNPSIGKTIKLTYLNKISCVNCGRKTNKSFNQGHCYPCFKSKAQCDMCIMKPEQCHHHEGTCREPEWGEEFCMTDHVVYLANSTGVKVGITRTSQVPTRWMDQGAVQALPIFRVATRRQSGLLEVQLANHVKDKTSWQAMLKGKPEDVDLVAKRDELVELEKDFISSLQEQFGEMAIQPVLNAEIYNFEYPVQQYPSKVKSFNFDKTPEVEGVLLGIKGQYLILDTGVINIRKFGGYHVELTVD